jgi:hypothetical protein
LPAAAGQLKDKTMADLFISQPQFGTITSVGPANPTQTIVAPNFVGPIQPAPKTSLSFFKYADSPEVWDSAGHHYSSMAELTAAGGAGKIQTVPRPAPKPTEVLQPSTTPPRQYNQALPVTGVNGTPAPTPPHTAQEFPIGAGLPPLEARKAQATVDRVFQPENISSTPYNMDFPGELKSAARAPFRAAVSALASVGGQKEPFTANPGAQRFFVGTDPITPLARQSADLELSLKEKGGLAGKFATPLGIGLPILGATLDLFPGLGGEEGKVAKEAAGMLADQLAKGISKDEALNAVYKQFGSKVGKLVEDEALPKLTEQIAKEAAPKLELPPLTKKDSLYAKLKNTLSPINGADPEAQATYRKFVNAKTSGKELANVEAKNLSNIPEKESWDTILKYEQGAETPHSGQIKETFDSLRQEAIDRGLTVPQRQNYVPQMYKNTPDEVALATAHYMQDKGVAENVITDYLAGKNLPEEIASKLGLDPGFTKQRVFPDYATAMQYGLKPKYTSPAQLAGAYRASLESAVANRNLIGDLVAQGKLVTKKGLNMKPVDITFSPQVYFAEPKLAAALNNLTHDAQNLTFGQAGLQKVSKVSKFMQELALSAGFPGTDVNFFSMGQLIKQLTARTGEVVTSPLKSLSGIGKDITAFARANLDSQSIRFFEEKAPIIQKMAENGIDISERVGNFRDMYKNMVAKPSYKEALGRGWDTAFQKKTFASFMPQLYINTFESTYKTALKKGLSEEVASATAAEATRAFHGLTEDVARSKTTQDALSAIFFAPKFREGIVNTLWNTGKSLTTELRNPAFAKSRQLAAGMALTYAGYQYLNHKLNGNYTWQNEPGHEFDLKIPLPGGKNVLYVPFMPSFMSLPRNIGSAGIALYKGDLKTVYQKGTSLLSMPLQVSGQIITNQDYFGNPIYKDTDTRTEKITKIGQYLGLQANHPYLKLVSNYIDNKREPDKAFRKPLTQSLLEASEFPVKFETLDRISRSQFYAAADQKAQQSAQDKKRIQPIYDQVQKLKDSGDDAGAQTIVDGLSEEDYNIYKAIKSSGTRTDTINSEARLFQTYQHLQQLKQNGREDEAQRIVDDMPDDEYKAYELLKKRFNQNQ